MNRRGGREKAAESLLKSQAEGWGPTSFRVTMAGYLEALTVRAYSKATCHSRASDLLRFARWAEERGLVGPAETTRPVLEQYQRHLFYVRKPNGRPLGTTTQQHLLTSLKGYFRWCARQALTQANPAADLLLPRLGVRLPRATLTPTQVEKVLAQPNVKTAVGLKDRAVLEVLWATGLRRSEVVQLSLYDVREEAGAVFVREGKGKKDRVVPVSARCLGWVRRYVEEARPRLVVAPDEGRLFVSDVGNALSPTTLSREVAAYVKAAEVGVKGGCHLFRHACATAMLEGGADVRFVQELLGHASLETTQVYTRVTITKLKAVYEATHPGARATVPEAATVDNVTAEDVLAALEAEDEAEAEAETEMG